MSDDKTERAILKGKEAQSLLDNPVLTEAFAEVEAGIIDTWRRSPADDPAGRERLWMALRNTSELKKYLTVIVEEGRTAQAQLDEIHKFNEFNALNLSPGETADEEKTA